MSSYRLNEWFPTASDKNAVSSWGPDISFYKIVIKIHH